MVCLLRCCIKGNLEEAARLYQRALTVTQTQYGDNHARTAYALSNFSRMKRAQGEQQAALEMANRALLIYRRVHGVNHKETRRVQGNIRQWGEHGNKHNKHVHLYPNCSS